ncbi:ribonuclease P protein component [Chloroflexus sp.]|uniref:ribonuclease P protein component n=1 Tax=Chloroflexus sp. TaxID=1904827 RepID=UPI002ACEA5D8|nr:ribonuclease P protein component [Chloroflexus sp.]
MRRANRLRRPEQFRRVRHEGRTVTSPWLALTVAPGRRNAVRCGFVAGRRIGGAVQRNRARRRVREAVRLLLPSLQSGYDLVFMIRSPEVVEAPFSQLQADIAALLRQACLLNAPESKSTASTSATSHPQYERGSS